VVEVKMGAVVVHSALLEEIANSTCSSRGSSGVAILPGDLFQRRLRKIASSSFLAFGANSPIPTTHRLIQRTPSPRAQQLLLLPNTLHQRAGTGGARAVPPSQWVPLGSAAPFLIVSAWRGAYPSLFKE
jgi:hypothetical protein